MKNFFLVIYQDIKQGDNLIVYISIPIALTIAILGLIGSIGFSILSATILFVLTFLLSLLLLTRKCLSNTLNSINKVSDKFDKFEKKHISPCFSDIIFKEYPDFTESIANATSIKMLGSTLAAASGRYYNNIKNALLNNCSMSIMLCEATPSVIESLVIASSSSKYDNFDTLKKITKLNLQRYKMRLSNLLGENSNSEIRTLPYPPPYGLVIFEYANGFKELYVKLLVVQTHYGNYPTMALDNQKDIDWFNFFESQYDKIWQTSLPIRST